MQGRTFLHLRLRTWVLAAFAIVVGLAWWFGSPHFYGNSNQYVCAQKVVHYPSKSAAVTGTVKHFPITADDRIVTTTRYNDYYFTNDTTVVYRGTNCHWWQKSYADPGFARTALLPNAWGLLLSGMLLYTSVTLLELAKRHDTQADVLEDETTLREAYERFIAEHHGLGTVVDLTEQALGDTALKPEPNPPEKK